MGERTHSEAEDEVGLWTWQGARWDIVDSTEPVRHDRGPYKDDSQIQAAYRQLAERIGTDQWVWCYLRPEDCIHREPGKVEWALRVPRQRVLAFIDNSVWIRILGDWERTAVPPHVRDLLRAKASPEGTSLKELQRRWWLSVPDSYDKLLLCDPGCAFAGATEATALVRHPVPEEYVIRRPVG